MSVTSPASHVRAEHVRPLEEPARARTTFVALAFTIVVATLWLYAPARHFEFIAFDDADYVAENKMVQAGLTMKGMRWAFSTGHAGNWHPLTWLSHQLDAELAGGGPAPAHVTNILLHAANALLVLIVLHALTGAVWRSGWVAAVFALHPLHVESVAWIAERKDVLSAFFFLLTLWAYVRHARATTVGSSRSRSRWYWMAWALFACGLLSKPMVVTLPCVLLLLDFWPLGRWQMGRWDKLRTLCVEKLPFFALTVVSSAITFIVQRRGGAVESLDALSLGERVANAAVSCARYLGKTFWPTELAIFYPHPANWPAGIIVGAALLLATLVFGMWRLHRVHPFVPVGGLWFFGMLVPTLGLVQVGMQSMADRYTYLPSLGLFVAVAWGAAALRTRVPVAALAAAGVAAVAACAAATAGQLDYWRNSEALFGRALAVTEGNFVAHNSLGYALHAEDRDAEAIAHFRRALEIRPDFADAHNNLGSALLDQGDVQNALRSFRAAVEHRPGFALARYNLGTTLLQVGRTDDAIRELETAAVLRPDDELAHLNLGNAWLQAGQPDRALAQYHRVLALVPDHADALCNSGSALLQSGRVADAVAAFRQALASQPTHVNAHFNLGEVLLRTGQPRVAVGHLEQVLALAPEDQQAREYLQIARQQAQSAAAPPTP